MFNGASQTLEAALPETHTNISYPEDSPSPAMYVIPFLQDSFTYVPGCHWKFVVCNALAVTVLSQYWLCCPLWFVHMDAKDTSRR